MGKNRKKNPLPITPSPSPRLPVTSIKDECLRFRFDYFDAKHSHFDGSIFDNDWAKNLLNRLKAFQNVTVSQFKKCMQFRQSQYVHEINWDEAKVNSFGIRNGKEYDDDDAWQFGLSKTNGRIHGFFIGTLFYIVWLDPEHRLFKYQKP